jgi:hypothetical protein
VKILAVKLADVQGAGLEYTYNCDSVGHICLDIRHECAHNHANSAERDSGIPLKKST